MSCTERSIACLIRRALLVIALLAPQWTILNAQAANVGALSIDDVTVSEGDGRVVAIFAVTLTPPDGPPVTVDYRTAGGSATSGADFFPSSGTLEFRADDDLGSPRPNTRYIPVLIAGDALNEALETFTVELSNASKAVIVDGTGRGSIEDDDPLPVLSIAGGSSSEASETPASFLISLSSPSGRTVSVEYVSSDGTASSSTDFTATSGTAVFQPGVTEQRISIPITNDTSDEDDESFSVALTNPTFAIVGGPSATWVISDDDAAPSISISDVSMFEGDTDASVARFVLSLSETSGRTVGVDYITLDGTAASPSDYASAGGRIELAPGQRTGTLAVHIVPDMTFETDETFSVLLSGPQGASLGDADGIATILNDDAPPRLNISDATVVEGNSGTVAVSLTVGLSHPAGTPVLVNFASSDGTASSADYNSSSGSLVFLPGETTRQIIFQVKGDAIDEVDETFLVSLSDPSGAEIADPQGIVTILDNDSPPNLRVNNTSITEADSDSTMTVSVSLSATSGKPITVGFATADGSAVSPDDYTPVSGTLAFPPGATSTSLQVPIKGDDRGEADEIFLLNLSDPINAGFAKSSADMTIVNDDPALSFVADELIVDTEREAPGNQRLTFTVRLSPASVSEVSVLFATADGTAMAAGDYVAQAGRLVFAPGEVMKQIPITMNGDTAQESRVESFSINLQQATGADLVESSAVGTIWDDDPIGLLSLWNYAATEGFPVLVANTLYRPRKGPHIDPPPHASDVPISSTFRADSGEAFAGADFVPTVGDLPIRPGRFTSDTFPVPTILDAECEWDEYFWLYFENPVNAFIVDRFAWAWIYENSPTCL